MSGDKMRCKNKFCIYHDNGECFVDEVRHDESGKCLRCVYVKISDEEIMKLKEDTVDDLQYLMEGKVKKHHTPGYFD